MFFTYENTAIQINIECAAFDKNVCFFFLYKKHQILIDTIMIAKW